ncbi:hypothetical protein HKX48_003018 [Thoreauomyces humboldtii]|nr:hypothetical protein HKX48_003018 [Thoreauomyces humboldtii]
MEVMIVRKIGIPKYREVAMGAMCANYFSLHSKHQTTEHVFCSASGNFKYMARGRMTNFGVTDADAKEIIAEELDELRRREQKYRRGARFPDLTNKTVILADDGIATGATLRVALMAVRSHNPSCVIVAAPVGPESTARELRKEADEVVVIRTPQAFSCVGQWYDSFPETHDEEVLKLLAQAEEAGLGRS